MADSLMSLIDIDHLIEEDERLIQKSVREFVADRVRLNIAERFESCPAKVSVGKLDNVREAISIARSCRTVLGDKGTTLEYPVLRHALALESVLIYEDTTEVHQLALERSLTETSDYR